MRDPKSILPIPLLLVTAIAACGTTPPPSGQAAPGSSTVAPAASAAPASSASASSTASAAASPGAVPSASASAAPVATLAPAASAAPSGSPRLRGVATSPGQIGCGAVECDAATQLCCEDFGGKSGKCVDKSAKAGCGTVEVLWKACDEAADCGKGEVCCYSPRPDESVYASNVCRKKCQGGEPEQCLSGSACSGKKHCKDLKDNGEGWCH